MDNTTKPTPFADPNDVKEEKKMRQIIIETDGDNIKLVKAEVIGTIELIAILQNVILHVNNNNNNKK